MSAATTAISRTKAEARAATAWQHERDVAGERRKRIRAVYATLAESLLTRFERRATYLDYDGEPHPIGRRKDGCKALLRAWCELLCRRALKSGEPEYCVAFTKPYAMSLMAAKGRCAQSEQYATCAEILAGSEVGIVYMHGRNGHPSLLGFGELVDNFPRHGRWMVDRYAREQPRWWGPVLEALRASDSDGRVVTMQLAKLMHEERKAAQAARNAAYWESRGPEAEALREAGLTERARAAEARHGRLGQKVSRRAQAALTEAKIALAIENMATATPHADAVSPVGSQSDYPFSTVCVRREFTLLSEERGPVAEAACPDPENGAMPKPSPEVPCPPAADDRERGMRLLRAAVRPTRASQRRQTEVKPRAQPDAAHAEQPRAPSAGPRLTEAGQGGGSGLLAIFNGMNDSREECDTGKVSTVSGGGILKMPGDYAAISAPHSQDAGPRRGPPGAPLPAGNAFVTDP